MRELNSKDRSSLLKQSHTLSPRVWIGKKGLVDNIIENVDTLIEQHELMKIKFLGFKDSKNEIMDTISKKTGVTVVKIVGNIAVIYRPAKEKVNRKVFP
jgi:RNA-binding protein